MGNLPLLYAGVELSNGLIRALDQQGIYAVWVYDALSDGIEPAELLPTEVRIATAAAVAESLRSARDAFARRQPLAEDVISDLSKVVDAIMDSIVESPAAALALSDLAAADQYTHRHSVNVAALGLVLGREMMVKSGWTDWRGEQRFDNLDGELAKLGMGLLLHDIGKMSIPSEILNKPAALDEEEWALIRTHPDAGAELLSAESISPVVRNVVRQHHERWDGSGYPAGLVGRQISEFARITAVADVYDAMTSNRPYKTAMKPCEAVQVIGDGNGTAFDPDVVTAFRRIVFPYPVGTDVTLPDGRAGVVARSTPPSPTARSCG